MLHAERTIAVRRPVEQVLRFLSDPRTGTQWRAADLDVTSIEPGRQVAFRVRAGPASADGAFTLEAMGDATILTCTLDAALPWWRRLLLGGLVRRALDRELATLDALQELLER